jgi:SAM-dependent methyltransferase
MSTMALNAFMSESTAAGSACARAGIWTNITAKRAAFVMQFVYTRYLAAKRSVDDRALNRVVLDTLRADLAALGEQPLQVLELGAGIGTMAARLIEWNVLSCAHYTLLDEDSESLRVAQRQLGSSQRSQAYQLEYVCQDLFGFLDLPESVARYDLVVAHAVLDLVDVAALLPRLWRALKPGRPFWFAINFDGDTVFLPELAHDREILGLYHRSMDTRVREGHPAGHSQTGRRLLELVPASGARITCAGSSDWVVWPRSGAYPQDEAYFLHCIVHTIDGALRSHPKLDAASLAVWVDARHEQIRRAELCFMARQLDLAGRAP